MTDSLSDQLTALDDRMEVPSSDADVAVEWWHRYDDDGNPELDTFHGFHDPTQLDIADCNEEEAKEQGYIVLSHSDALAEGIGPCSDCYPYYATKHRGERAADDDRFTGDGIKGVVFPLSVRPSLADNWTLDSVHDNYASLQYRAQAIREEMESVGNRLRVSYMPIRRCNYTTVDEAAQHENRMQPADDLLDLTPDILDDLRAAVGADVLETRVTREMRMFELGAGIPQPSLVHQYEDRPAECGYTRSELSFQDELSEGEREALEESQSVMTVASVIEDRELVEFCEACFPEVVGFTDQESA